MTKTAAPAAARRSNTPCGKVTSCPLSSGRASACDPSGSVASIAAKLRAKLGNKRSSWRMARVQHRLTEAIFVHRSRCSAFRGAGASGAKGFGRNEADRAIARRCHRKEGAPSAGRFHSRAISSLLRLSDTPSGSTSGSHSAIATSKICWLSAASMCPTRRCEDGS